MFVKVKGGKRKNPFDDSDIPRKRRKVCKRKVRQRVIEYPSKYYDKPHVKPLGVAASVACRRRAPWKLPINKRKQWRQVVTFQISKERPSEKIVSGKTSKFIQKVMFSYKNSKTPTENDVNTSTGPSSSSRFSSLLNAAKFENTNTSISFASKNFPNFLKCSNEMCKKKWPDTFLSQGGRTCKRCGGHTFYFGDCGHENKTQEVKPNAHQMLLDRIYSQSSNEELDSRGASCLDVEMPQLAAFPEALNTEQYMERIIDVQRGTQMLEFEDMFGKY